LADHAQECYGGSEGKSMKGGRRYLKRMIA
jgi:hypothetical protein